VRAMLGQQAEIVVTRQTVYGIERGPAAEAALVAWGCEVAKGREATTLLEAGSRRGPRMHRHCRKPERASPRHFFAAILTERLSNLPVNPRASPILPGLGRRIAIRLCRIPFGTIATLGRARVPPSRQPSSANMNKNSYYNTT